MVRCELYESRKKTDWDEFVDLSKTPLFFLRRDFLEYHEKSFSDSSLMFYSDDILIALLPATRDHSVLTSHAGVTYGGIIISPKTKIELVVEVLLKLKSWAAQEGVARIIYKVIPYIFHTQSAQEDLYVLHNVLGASLLRRDLSSVVFLQDRLKLSKGRKWLVARAKKNNLEVVVSHDWSAFHSLLSQVLSKHGAAPVHSVAELDKLARLFPQQFVLKAVLKDGRMISAALLFYFNTVVHTQYLATDEEGKDLGALDFIVESCIQDAQERGFKYFNFGVSTEQQGKVLNYGLIAQKESFGSRGVVLDFYEIKI